MKDIKKVNLPISRKFPARHPREGQSTGLVAELLKGSKKHTIRDNIDYWEGKVARVNAGDMYISAKMWIGRPYHSSIQEMKRITKAGTQRIEMNYIRGELFVRIDGKRFTDLETLAANDGLSLEDFIAWFFPGRRIQHKGVIIHFTDLRY